MPPRGWVKAPKTLTPSQKTRARKVARALRGLAASPYASDLERYNAAGYLYDMKAGYLPTKIVGKATRKRRRRKGERK